MCNNDYKSCPNCKYSDEIADYRVVTIGTSEPENLLLAFGVVIITAGILNITNYVLVIFLALSVLPCLLSISRYPACLRCGIAWENK